MISLPGITVGPQGVAGAALPLGNDTPPGRIDTFIDYMCPFCRRFEEQNGAQLQSLVDHGVATWVVHPLAFLDRMSQGSMYSTRAAAAAYAVAQGAPASFGAFNAALFRDQPKEGTPGLSEAELEHLANEIGVEKVVTHTFAAQEFFNLVQSGTQLSIDAGVQGTPTVLLSTRKAGTYQWDGTTSIADALSAMAKA